MTNGRGGARSSVSVGAGRRRRRALRRTLSVLATLAVVGGAIWTYAAVRGDDPPPTVVAGLASDGDSAGVEPSGGDTAGGDTAGGDTAGGEPAGGETAGGEEAAAGPAPTPKSASPTKPATSPTTPAKRRTAGLAPVVTDGIPAPTTSIALDAPVPGTTNMQSSAAAAYDTATAAAARAGVTVSIRSAWRSAAYQQILFDRAVRTYGSSSEAGKWVLSPQRSAHVKGYAVDVQPRAAGTWLEANGAKYGLCRTYANEWWHFEYLATSDCPAMKPSALG